MRFSFRPISWFCFSALALFALPAQAADSPEKRLEKLESCVHSGRYAECRDYFTASSLDYYDRFTSYDLVRCLPIRTQVISQTTSGPYRLLRVEAYEGDERRARTQVSFTQEEGAWKLDLPHTLLTGLGEGWENQVALTEQIYLALRARMNGQLGCEAIAALMPRVEGE